jgi:hypothetical protein
MGILFVSPHLEDAIALPPMLDSLSVTMEHVADLAHARPKIRDGAFRVILTEANLPDGTWLDVLDLARRVKPVSEVIVTDPDADPRFWARRSTWARTTLSLNLSPSAKCGVFLATPVRVLYSGRPLTP